MEAMIAKMIAKLLIAAGVFIIGTAAVGEIKDTVYGDSSDMPSTVEIAEPEIHTTADEIINAYIDNRDSADLIYKGHTIAVTGIYKSSQYHSGQYYVTIGIDSPLELTNVVCIFDEEQDFTAGQEIAIAGYCEKYFINILLKDCKALTEG